MHSIASFSPQRTFNEKHTEEPKGWIGLHVGADGGVNCEHIQVSMANLLQKHLQWQEHKKETLLHGTHMYNTMYLARLDVQTAFDVAKLHGYSSVGVLMLNHTKKNKEW